MTVYFIMNTSTLGLVCDLETLDEVEVCDKECAIHNYKKDLVEEMCAVLNATEGNWYDVVEYNL